MTTIERQCKRMLKVLRTPPAKAGFIPPQILQECKGIMFFKKLNAGEQSVNSSGVMLKRDPVTGQWSLPTSVHFAEGTVRFGVSSAGDATTRACDLVILINDSNTLDAFQAFGQFGFDDEHHKCVSGPVVGGASSGTSELVEFATACSTDPFYLLQNSFAFSLCSSAGIDSSDTVPKWYTCSISNAVFQVRDSSNHKYYNNKAATWQAILSSASDSANPSRSTKLIGGLSRQRVDQTLEVRQMLADWMPKKPVDEQPMQGLSKSDIGVAENLSPAPAEEIHVDTIPMAGLQRRLSFTF